jgi:hypothetical protein
MNRRKLLKATGATITTAPLFGVASAREDTKHGRSFEEHAAQARKIRKKTGSQEQFVKYHRRHADYVTNKQWNKKLPHHRADKDDSDGPSNERLYSGESDVEITVGYYLREDCGGEDYAQIDLHADITTDQGGDGKPDKDNFALAWNDDHYRYEDGSAYIDGCNNCSLRKQELNGVSWDWSDGDACYYSCDTNFALGCNAELLTTDQERAIQAKHNHTWNELEISGVSFSSGGNISVQVSTDDYLEELAYRIVEEPFDVESFC